MGQKLWGITSGSESMPNWLTDKQKKNVIADKGGWVLRHPSGIEETLVAISRLGTKLGGPTPSFSYWNDADYFTAQTNREVFVEFNEKITKSSGTPTIVLTGGSSVVDFDIVDGGTGYTEATIVVEGDGFQAVLTPTIVDGVITDVTIDNAGSGYRNITLSITGDGEGAEITATLGSPVTVTATYSAIVGTELNTAKFTFTAPNNTGDWLQVLPQTIANGTFVEAGTATAATLAIGQEAGSALKQIIWD